MSWFHDNLNILTTYKRSRKVYFFRKFWSISGPLTECFGVCVLCYFLVTRRYRNQFLSLNLVMSDLTYSHQCPRWMIYIKFAPTKSQVQTNNAFFFSFFFFSVHGQTVFSRFVTQTDLLHLLIKIQGFASLEFLKVNCGFFFFFIFWLCNCFVLICEPSLRTWPDWTWFKLSRFLWIVWVQHEEVWVLQ